MLKFANYGFNKSHSVAYGLLAYQLSYLKANFPLELYLSLLNSVIGAEGKTAANISTNAAGIRLLEFIWGHRSMPATCVI